MTTREYCQIAARKVLAHPVGDPRARTTDFHYPERDHPSPAKRRSSPERSFARWHRRPGWASSWRQLDRRDISRHRSACLASGLESTVSALSEIEAFGCSGDPFV